MCLILLHQLRHVNNRHRWHPIDRHHCGQQRTPESRSRWTLVLLMNATTVFFFSVLYMISAIRLIFMNHPLSRTTRGCTAASPVRCFWVAGNACHWWKGAVSGAGHHHEEVCIWSQASKGTATNTVQNSPKIKNWNSFFFLDFMPCLVFIYTGETGHFISNKRKNVSLLQVWPRHPGGVWGTDALLGLPPSASCSARSGPLSAAVTSARYDHLSPQNISMYCRSLRV